MKEGRAEGEGTALSPEQRVAFEAYEAGGYLPYASPRGPEWGLQHLDELVDFHGEMQPLLAELHAAGFPIRHVFELRSKVNRPREHFRLALPILLRHFATAKNREVRYWIARALKNPHARPEAAAPLLNAWRLTDPAEKWAHLDYTAYGEAMRKVSHDAVFDQIAELVQDRRYRWYRNNLVEALRFLRHPGVADLLTRLLDDDDVAYWATAILIVRQERRAIPHLERLRSHPEVGVRSLVELWLPVSSTWPATPRIGPDPLQQL